MPKAKKPKTVRVWALTPEQADKWWGWSDDEIETELGNESYNNLRERMDKKELNLRTLANSIGISETSIRKGVKKGQRFPQKPGVFDKMCRQLGFAPNEAGKVLGGIYDEQRRSSAIGARLHASAALMEMHDLYDQIRNPTDKQLAEVAIYALWRQLKLLTERQS